MAGRGACCAPCASLLSFRFVLTCDRPPVCVLTPSPSLASLAVASPLRLLFDFRVLTRLFLFSPLECSPDLLCVCPPFPSPFSPPFSAFLVYGAVCADAACASPRPFSNERRSCALCTVIRVPLSPSSGVRGWRGRQRAHVLATQLSCARAVIIQTPTYTRSCLSDAPSVLQPASRCAHTRNSFFFLSCLLFTVAVVSGRNAHTHTRTVRHGVWRRAHFSLSVCAGLLCNASDSSPTPSLYLRRKGSGRHAAPPTRRCCLPCRSSPGQRVPVTPAAFPAFLLPSIWRRLAHRRSRPPPPLHSAGRC